MMSSLFHSHFTFTSICALTPSFPGFLRLARTCSHSLHACTTRGALQYTMHLVQDSQIPINPELPTSLRRGQPKKRMFEACSPVCLTLFPSTAVASPNSHTASSDRQGEHCVNRGRTVSCGDRARKSVWRWWKGL